MIVNATKMEKKYVINVKMINKYVSIKINEYTTEWNRNHWMKLGSKYAYFYFCFMLVSDFKEGILEIFLSPRKS